ncbi:hypothetical protein [Lonepinella koalarum]|uniref:hypothetical protein n=1 Tax=Lonepinella koalarum TaxID=53417 RepID=UPI00104788A7|nr:hypothetical protein [Lonepinella koalarum]TFJ90452.1 hypothetical protein E0709_03685 [Lonepinella koalarum]
MKVTFKITQQIKSRQCVTNYDEVFTRPPEVNAMIDMVMRDKGLPISNAISLGIKNINQNYITIS